jgi:hypothetical protein
VYATVYSGVIPYSCSVDSSGNLFFTTSNNEINAITYLDLWDGEQNKDSTVFNYATG